MTINWGILSTGTIAKAFANGVIQSQSGKLVAVGSRTQASADSFAKEFNIDSAHSSYEGLLADSKVDAVYIATPHPIHAEWAIKAAEAGKHILCEKPLTINHAEAMVVAEAARENSVFLMEAFMYRCQPQTKKLVELIASKTIGDVKLIQASFGFRASFSPDGRLFSNKLAGGGILDVGCYPVSMARLIAGAVEGKPFLDPTSVQGMGELIEETGVDAYAVASLKFPNGILAQVSTGVLLRQKNDVVIYGTQGQIKVPNPWFCGGREGGESSIFVYKDGEDAPEEIAVKADQWLYENEADAVASALEGNQTSSRFMSPEDTLGNMKALDEWRYSFRFFYASERNKDCIPTVDRRPLKKKSNPPMKYSSINGLELPVSRLVFGCDNQKTLPHAAAMLDDYYSRGGNTFDTAYIYGGGTPERLLGIWLKERQLRDETNIIVKGGHTPYCRPESIEIQLEESLDRLQIECADIYMMHRDNLDIPVEEFIDALNEHYNAGRIKVFGGSNWSTERIDAANAYAKSKGLQGFGVVSNNFSLARMVNPVWGGCIAASDPQQKKWFEKTQTPLLAWSSQARGFFTDRSGKNKTEDPELVNSWYSDENFERKERAIALAKEKGVTPINIALAFVLHQKFPTFALFGPRQISETVTSMPGLNVELSEEEVAWLDLDESKSLAAV
ncbi:MAG: aldo/keto reductase [Verrucomicrobiota bacterium]